MVRLDQNEIPVVPIEPEAAMIVLTEAWTFAKPACCWRVTMPEFPVTPAELTAVLV